MNDWVRRIWNGFTTLLAAVAVLLALLLVGVRLIGFQIFTVQTPSMEPKYSVGSVIYVKNVAPDDLQIGDVITFRTQGGNVVTHRIVEVFGSGSGRSFRTQGDANNVADGGSVSAENVIGKVVFSIPGLGYVSQGLHTTQGRIIAGGAVVLLVVMMMLSDVLWPKQEKEEEQEQEEKQEQEKDT